MSYNIIIREIINAIFPISHTSLSEILSITELETYRLGTNFITVNNKNNKEYFVLDGVCGSYLTNPDGNDIFISFFKKNSVISPHTTRSSKGLSLLNFKALTELELASLNAQEFEKLMVENLEIREFANTVLRNELSKKVEKEISLASSTAKERLIKLRKEFPLLENLIPHPYIASYLGITNVSLSRLRKNLI